MSEWIEWSGGDCPVEDDALVETKGRNGDIDTNVASFWCWDHAPYWPESDIIAYRIVAPSTTGEGKLG